MKKFLLLIVVAMAAIFNTNAQIKVESPHPDLDIQVKRCANSSGTVVIDMIITNFGQEETLRFYGSSSGGTAYDDDGNQYTSSNSRISLGLLSIGLDPDRPYVTLPQDIPMKFRIEVQKVKPNATKFMLLKIPVESSGAMALKKEKPIQFRNVEWAK